MSATIAPKLIWSDAYATGVDEIDEQHMILVHTLNEASERLAIDSSPEALGEITQNLLSYALYHFETEEEMMQEYGYDESLEADAKSHLAQHRAFAAKVVAVRDGIQAGTPIAPEDLIGFLNEWLVNHILKTDKKLAGFIIEKRSA